MRRAEWGAGTDSGGAVEAVEAADRDGRNPRLLIEATAADARLADTSGERPG